MAFKDPSIAYLGLLSWQSSAVLPAHLLLEEQLVGQLLAWPWTVSLFQPPDPSASSPPEVILKLIQ
jgi:hypothetical protein